MRARMSKAAEYRDILLVEAIGPFQLLTAFPKLLKDALWIHFIDNTAAEASLISGSLHFPLPITSWAYSVRK